MFCYREMSSLHACVFALTDVTVLNYAGLTQEQSGREAPFRLFPEALLHISSDILSIENIVEKFININIDILIYFLPV